MNLIGLFRSGEHPVSSGRLVAGDKDLWSCITPAGWACMANGGELRKPSARSGYMKAFQVHARVERHITNISQPQHSDTAKGNNKARRHGFFQSHGVHITRRVVCAGRCGNAATMRQTVSWLSSPPPVNPCDRISRPASVH